MATTIIDFENTGCTIPAGTIGSGAIIQLHGKVTIVEIRTAKGDLLGDVNVTLAINSISVIDTDGVEQCAEFSEALKITAPLTQIEDFLKT